jgi:hypothetical protein
MAVTFSGSHAEYSNVKDTFPQSTALTGGNTIDGVNDGRLITGTGTLFKTELQVGEYLYIAAQSAYRRINGINSNTELTLDEAFPTATFVNATARRTPPQRFREYSWVIEGLLTAKIDNLDFLGGQSETKSYMGGVRPGPVLIDTTPNANVVKVGFTV